MPTDAQFLACFRMPAGQTIMGRTSSIRNAFVAAITPVVPPNPAQIKEVLDILYMDPTNLRCSYCGDASSEWDHLQPLVDGGKPTGYPSSITNLVPSCGKCNQSKGKTHWKIWMLGAAARSPTTRRIADIRERITRLEAYEKWASCQPHDLQSCAPASLWGEYYRLQDEILRKMKEAQALADRLKAAIALSFASAQSVELRGQGMAASGSAITAD